MKYVYPACFYKSENEDGYTVLFVDFECATQADDLAEAMAMAADAGAGWIVGSLEQGETLPEPSPLENVKPEDGGFVSLVCMDLNELSKQPIQKTLTIPSWLNHAAERKNINFSATLTDALIEKLAR